MRLKFKASLIKVQRNQNPSPRCIYFFKRGWDWKNPERIESSLYFAFSAPQSHPSPSTTGYSARSAPQPGEGFGDSVSRHIWPRWHHRSPKGSASCVFAQPVLIAGEFHLFSNWIQSLTTQIMPAQHLSLIYRQFFILKREDKWKSSWTNSSP